MPTSPENDRLDLVIERADPAANGTEAARLLVQHGVTPQKALAAIQGAAAGMPGALRLSGVTDLSVLLTALADHGVTARPMTPPATDAEMAQWRAEDPDMSQAGGRDAPAKPHPPTLVQRLRQRLHLSQTQFAERYGIPVHSVRAWEIRRTRPEATALAFLAAIDADPEGVARACAKARDKAAAGVPAEAAE
jgi:putative transcriptional regulator